MEKPTRYVEAVTHIMMIGFAGLQLAAVERAAEAAGYSMFAFNGRIWARDDDAGGKWIKTPLTVEMLRF